MEEETNKTNIGLNMRRHKTGIAGLDALFYGGIQLDPNPEDSDGLLIMARGEHGVNKIHLAMQMCEGLCISQNVIKKDCKKDEEGAFKSYCPLSFAIDEDYSFDELSIIKMLVVEKTMLNLKEYSKEKANAEEKWRGFYRRFSEDILFARKCAARYVEETINNRGLINGYWLKVGSQENCMNKSVIEEVLKDSIKDFDMSLLNMFVAYETTDSVIERIKRIDRLKKQGDKDGIKEIASHAHVFSKCIEDTLKDNRRLLNQYCKYGKKENVELALFKKIVLREESNFDNASWWMDNVDNSSMYVNKKVLFISLNKDGDSLRNKYYDFYIQRLIRNVRSENDFACSSINLLRRMIWYVDESCCERGRLDNSYLVKYELPSISGAGRTERAILVDSNEGWGQINADDANNDVFADHIRSGFIYYNGRTHGLHLRHQKGAPDTEDMLLCKLYIPEESLVKIIGRDELNDGNRMADGLTSFLNLLAKIDDCYKDNKEEIFDCILVDGLSRLTKEEIAQCPFNALSDKLRKVSKIGVITADEKIKSSDISVDIIIDMAIKERSNPDHLYHALNISKCLYQRNAYGWHSYFMRMAGIEVIPSLGVQMATRYHMDDVVADALLPLNEDPYPYWLNESILYSDETIRKVGKPRNKENFYNRVYKNNNNKQLPYDENKSVLKGYLYLDKDSAIKMIINELGLEKYKEDGFLFIDLNYNRTEFKNKYYNFINEQIDIEKKNNIIHMFNFQPGYLHSDEFLWVIDQQVKAISRICKDEEEPDTHHNRVHLIIGDLNYMNFAYPCLNGEGLVLPALASYTKKHHMTNFVYASVPSGSNIKLLDKEREIIRQMWAVVGTDNMTEDCRIKNQIIQ